VVVSETDPVSAASRGFYPPCGANQVTPLSQGGEREKSAKSLERGGKEGRMHDVVVAEQKRTWVIHRFFKMEIFLFTD
jgi:hypothetical protein